MYLQERIDFIESEIQEITKNAQNLKTDYLALIELKLLIEKTQTFFQDHSAHRKISASVQIYNNEGALGHLGFIAGVVTTSRVPSFERMLWRISHGNIFFKQAQIDEPLKDPVTVSQFFHLLKGSFFYTTVAYGDLQHKKHRIRVADPTQDLWSRYCHRNIFFRAVIFSCDFL